MTEEHNSNHSKRICKNTWIVLGIIREHEFSYNKTHGRLEHGYGEDTS